MSQYQNLDNDIMEVINEMALPLYILGDVTEFNLMTSTTDIKTYIRAIVFLVAIKNNMTPDIDFIYNNDITDEIRDFVETIKSRFGLTIGYEEPIVDDGIAEKIKEIYDLYDNAEKNGFFYDYLHAKVSPDIMHHIKANTAQIAYILYGLKSETLRKTLTIVNRRKYDADFVLSMELIIMADVLVFYDQMRFDIFDKIPFTEEFEKT